MAYEIITTTNKQKRDHLFQDLKNNPLSTPEEKQVVKFSSVQPVTLADGMPKFCEPVRYTATGKGGKVNHGRPQVRQIFETVYSVAYPELAAPKPNHGSARNPRKFPARKAS